MGRRRGCRASFHFLAAQRGILSGGEGERGSDGKKVACFVQPKAVKARRRPPPAWFGRVQWFWCSRSGGRNMEVPFEDHQCRCWDGWKGEANEVPRGTLSWQSGGQDGTDPGRPAWPAEPCPPNPDEQLVSPKRHVSRAAILTHQEGRKTSQGGRQPPLPVVAMPQPHRAQRQGVSPTPDCVLCAWLAAVIQLAIDLAHAPQARGGQRNRYTWSRID